jgi:hypothetical protein
MHAVLDGQHESAEAIVKQPLEEASAILSTLGVL